MKNTKCLGWGSPNPEFVLTRVTSLTGGCKRTVCISLEMCVHVCVCVRERGRGDHLVGPHEEKSTVCEDQMIICDLGTFGQSS